MADEPFSEFGGVRDQETEAEHKKLNPLKASSCGDSEEEYQRVLKRFDELIEETKPTNKPSLKFLIVIRWVLFFPAAFIALILSDLLFNLFDFWDAPFIEEPIKGAMTAAAALVVGRQIAPKGNRWVLRGISIPLFLLMLMSFAGAV